MYKKNLKSYYNNQKAHSTEITERSEDSHVSSLTIRCTVTPEAFLSSYTHEESHLPHSRALVGIIFNNHPGVGLHSKIPHGVIRGHRLVLEVAHCVWAEITPASLSVPEVKIAPRMITSPRGARKHAGPLYSAAWVAEASLLYRQTVHGLKLPSVSLISDRKSLKGKRDGEEDENSLRACSVFS